MAKKLLSLFSSQEVHLIPGEKSLPAAQFSKLVSAQEVLQLVKEESVTFKEQAVSEAEKIKEIAFAEGFQEGLISLNKHIHALDQEIKTLHTEIQKKILPLALKAARKIVGEELKLHPDRIVDIVLGSLKQVTQHRKIILYVNRVDLDALEANKSKIKDLFANLEILSIQERSDIEPGGCMIETEAGIINAQLENQWRAIEAAFLSFMGGA